MQELTFVTAPMPPELAQQARIAAAVQGISRSELIRRAVAEFLQRTQAGQAAQGVKNGG